MYAFLDQSVNLLFPLVFLFQLLATEEENNKNNQQAS
jgi:hypothetical protein